jgi:hypothetical protein
MKTIKRIIYTLLIIEMRANIYWCEDDLDVSRDRVFLRYCQFKRSRLK